MPRAARLDLAALDALAAGQHRCVTLAQLASVGVPTSTIAHRTRPLAGTWTRLLPGVVLLHRGTPTADELASAAILYGGAGAVLTGLESLRRHGLRRLSSTALVEVLIPDDRRRVSARFVVSERTVRMPAPRMVGGFPCAPVPRALVDAGRRLQRLDDVRAMTAEAIQRRLSSQDALLKEIRLAQRRGTARIRLVGSEIVGGIRSSAEADVRQVLLDEGFPPALWNHDLLTADGELIGCPDAWFDEEAVALEVDSREWHLDPQGWERTQRKRARCARFGIPTVPVTPQQLRLRRGQFLGDLHHALEAGKSRPRPDVRAVMRSQAA